MYGDLTFLFNFRINISCKIIIRCVRILCKIVHCAKYCLAQSKTIGGKNFE